MRVYVNYDKHTTVVRESSGQWDNGDTSTSHEVHGIVLNSNDCSFFSERLDIDFEVHAGEEYYLLYAVYSTGCSFGHDDNYCIEFIDLYKTKEKADEAYKLLDENANANKITFETESGKIHEYHTPWNDYFESISYIELKPVSLLMYKRKDFK
jgi:hypothetical protein